MPLLYLQVFEKEILEIITCIRFNTTDKIVVDVKKCYIKTEIILNVQMVSETEFLLALSKIIFFNHFTIKRGNTALKMQTLLKQEESK